MKSPQFEDMFWWLGTPVPSTGALQFKSPQQGWVDSFTAELLGILADREMGDVQQTTCPRARRYDAGAISSPTKYRYCNYEEQDHEQVCICSAYPQLSSPASASGRKMGVYRMYRPLLNSGYILDIPGKRLVVCGNSKGFGVENSRRGQRSVLLDGTQVFEAKDCATLEAMNVVGCDLDMPVDMSGHSKLHYAANDEQWNSVFYLLWRTIDGPAATCTDPKRVVGAADSEGNTVLHIVSQHIGGRVSLSVGLKLIRKLVLVAEPQQRNLALSRH
jgi:hypothetical protein